MSPVLASHWRREVLRTGLWFVPAVEVIAAIGLFTLTTLLDKAAAARRPRPGARSRRGYAVRRDAAGSIVAGTVQQVPGDRPPLVSFGKPSAAQGRPSGSPGGCHASDGILHVPCSRAAPHRCAILNPGREGMGARVLRTLRPCG